MEIRLLCADDIDFLDLQDIDHWAIDEIDDLHKWEGQAFTILDDTGRPVGISGFSLKDGIGTGWLIGSRQLRTHSIYLHRTMKRVLSELLRNPVVTCIYADVELRSVGAGRWLERLGFKLESENAGMARYVIVSKERQPCQF